MSDISERKIGAMPPDRFISLLYKKAKIVKSHFPNLTVQNEILEILKVKEGSDLTKLSRIFELKSQLPTENIQKWMTFMVALERWQNIHLKDQDFLSLQNKDDWNKPVQIIPLIIILENIRSSFNVGSILRSAECFGVQEVILTGYTATPENHKVAKSAMGVEDFVRWTYEESTLTCLSHLKKKGFKTFALEKVDGAININDFHSIEPAAIVLGNEEFGVSKEVLQHVEDTLEIPLVGRKNSLNVSVAAAIAIQKFNFNFFL
jgi:tRNA G18 (ribose-2'-O)-methylase SpoU